jgi:uncharacterized protein YdeI (YjbR/CyaY-like superfamily)
LPSVVDYERIHPATRAAWRAWLEQHHATTRGVWVVQWRSSVGGQGPTYDDLVEEALCFGWIDGRANPLDDRRSMLMFTPRRPGSAWARSNKERVERLTAAGRMTPAGLRAIERAEADGSWTLLDDVDALVVPPDLASALAGDEQARRHFDAFPPSAKKAALYWIKTAKRPETRQRRIAETVRLASENRRAPR